MNETLPRDFQELIATNPFPVLVDFWAPWCAPCHMMTPILKQLSSDWKGRLTIIKVNTEEKRDLARRYAISALPTLVLFKDGKELHRVTGALPLPMLKRELESHISPSH